MFTTIMHLSINAAMQRPVDALPSPQGQPQRISAPGRAAPKPVSRPARRPAKTPILADSLRIAAGFY